MERSREWGCTGIRYTDMNYIIEELEKEGRIFRGVSYIAIKGR